jgi:hypothetical protein
MSPSRHPQVNRGSRVARSFALCAASALLLLGLATGCGSIQATGATEQLLASDAVDTAISKIDFRPLSGEKVFLETRYIQNLKVIGFVSAEYIISSLRQALTGAGVLLQDAPAQAEYIVEARVGTLGADGNEIVYGIPANNSLGIATTAVAATTATPAIPATIPEISFAKKKNQLAAAKVACYAYHRESKERVWQSGLSVAKSTARDTWVLGAGPFQKGTIYQGTGMAGSTLDVNSGNKNQPNVGFRESIVFERKPKDVEKKDEVQTASGEKAAKPADGKPAELKTPDAKPADPKAAAAKSSSK